MPRWKKPPAGLITPHYSFFELACRHCGRVPDIDVVRETALWLETVRAALGGHVMHVTSGCRCPEHNRRVGGAPESYHVRGMAVDFVLRGLSLVETRRRVDKLWGEGKIGGFGRYDSWIHIDRGPGGRTWEGP